MRTTSMAQTLIASASRISASATLSLGVIEQGNGFGRLEVKTIIALKPEEKRRTHLTRPPEYVY